MKTITYHFTISRWVKASFLGWFLGIVLLLLLSSLLEVVGIHHLQFYLGTGIGAGVGFIQWRMLRKILPVSKRWIWFSILGLSIPLLIHDILPKDAVTYYLPYAIILGGVLLGFMQYTILKKHSQNAGLWILGCLAGWAMAVVTVFSIDYTKHLPFGPLVIAAINLVLILAGGIVLGIVSGMFLKKILA